MTGNISGKINGSVQNSTANMQGWENVEASGRGPT